MGDFGRRTTKLGLLYVLAGLVGFGLAIGQGLSFQVSVITGAATAATLFMLVTLMFWRPGG